MSRLLLCALLLSCVSTVQAAKPIKALLITGGCCHDYENQKQIISEGLSQRANIEWDIVHEGGDTRDTKISVYEDPNWASGYDVIVHNECFGNVTDPEFVRSITNAHLKGVPAVFIHCSLHSYRNSGAAETWRELIGVTSTSHEKHRALKVFRLDTSHPVMTGFPKEWDTPNGELYKITKVWPNCTPLATAYGVDTMKDHPVIWVNTFGGTRVFGTSLGHHNETMLTDVWLDLVARGTLWATGKLTDDGKPVAGYEGTGEKPIKLPGLKPIAEPKSR